MGNPAIHHLFVYGSLRSGFRSEAYTYVSRYFSLVGNGVVKGRLYDLGSYPAAVPAEGDSFVHGELYLAKSVEEFSWAIGQLDDYEGVKGDEEGPALYRREPAEVFIDGKTVTAWIYWYSGSVEGAPQILSGDLLEYIRNK